jgi:hypothetical protein
MILRAEICNPLPHSELGESRQFVGCWRSAGCSVSPCFVAVLGKRQTEK